MSDPFIAEIRIFPFTFAPDGWALCNGQLLSIQQNTALFSLLGTTYGGDGNTSFALPNLQGRAPMHPGQGPGLSPRSLGEQGGSATVALTEAQMPTHSHTMQAAAVIGSSSTPQSNALAIGAKATPLYSPASAASGTMHAGTLSATGGGAPHNNMQPYLTCNFCIALEGIYPARG